jgi:hypothetical protein
VRTALVFLPNRCELCPLRYGLPASGGAGIAPDGRVAGSAPDLHGTTLAELAKGILRHG